jgi:metallo-beta-lactamase family protein
MLEMSRNLTRERVPGGDFKRTLEGLVPVQFGRSVEIGSVGFTFKRARHLLGAAFVEILADTGKRIVRVIFSGDLGSGGSLLLGPGDRPGRADYVVMESTYGAVTRDFGRSSMGTRFDEFAVEVGRALHGGGDVLIPAFALGRTQEVISVLDLYVDRGIIPAGTQIFIDSPTAKRVSAVYRKFREELSPVADSLYGDEILRRPYHREVKSRTSMKVHSRNHDPAVFISSSGNLDHANSPRHLVRMAEDGRNLLCIVGYQQPGSVGRKLADGDSTVLVRCREEGDVKEYWVSPSMRIVKTDAFSSHADREELARWAGSIDGADRIFLVHGEPTQAQSLKVLLENSLRVDVELPTNGQRFFLPARRRSK